MINRLGDLLEEIERLEPFPRAAIRVLELAQQDAEVDEIVAVIQSEPGLTLKVLRLANSVSGGSVVEVDSIQAAVNRLGRRAIANMAMATGCASVFMGYGGATPRSHVGLWTESLHTAILARRLAEAEGFVDAEFAFTAGLLQNLGHIVLDRFFVEEREQILERVAEGENMIRAERAILGMDHAFCGARIAQKWGLPESLIQGIRFHHAPHSSRGQESLCSILNLAERLTAFSLWNWDASMLYPGYDDEVAAAAPQGQDLQLMLAGVKAEMATIDVAVE